MSAIPRPALAAACPAREAQARAADAIVASTRTDAPNVASRPAFEIAAGPSIEAQLRLDLARANQRAADLRMELQLAVDEVCNEYVYRGHLERVRRLYDIEDRITAPSMLDTVRLAAAALLGKADPAAALEQCRDAYRNATGLELVV